MYAIQLSQPNLDALTRVDLELPRPGRGEVRVRIRGASLNYVDYAIARGAYKAPRFPLIPLADGAGEVTAVGDEVEELKLGDRVILHAKPAWIGGPVSEAANIMRGLQRVGSLAEEVVIAANAVVPAPAHLDWTQAACLPIAATTAFNALRAGDIRVGSRVLLLGTGGVSIMALQLAKAAGAHVTITSSSDHTLQRARTLGADDVINYREEPNWDELALQRSDGRGADLVLDTGGADTFARSLHAAAYGGTVFTIGFLTGVQSTVDLMAIIVKALRVCGNNTGSVADLRAATRAIAAARIVPVIDRVFGFDEVRGAYEQLATGKHFGKLAVAHP